MINYIVTHADDLLAVATTVVATASAVAALTPSPKDDGVIMLLRRVLDVLALNIGNAGRGK